MLPQHYQEHLCLLYSKNIRNIIGNFITFLWTNVALPNTGLKIRTNKCTWKDSLNPDLFILTETSYYHKGSNFTSISSLYFNHPPDKVTNCQARNKSPLSPCQCDSHSQLTHEDWLALLGLNWGVTEEETGHLGVEEMQTIPVNGQGGQRVAGHGSNGNY